MHSKNTKSEYTRSVLKVRNARIANVVLCAVGIAAAAALNAFSFGTIYRYTVFCISVSLVIFLAALLYKNAREIKASMEIARGGIYACKLSRLQRTRIARHQIRIGRQFSMFAFLVVFSVEAIILVTMYMTTESKVFLFFAAVFTMFCFGCALLSNLYLSARLYDKNTYCTVADNGVIVCGEVIRFSGAAGEVKELLVFDDYYCIKYTRRAVFGIAYTSRLIFPTDGSVKNGLNKSPEEILGEAFCVKKPIRISGEFYEAREYTAEKETAAAKATIKAN